MPAPLSGNGLTINRSIIARSLLAILLPMTTYSPAWASTEVSEDVHEKCPKAADYLGCVEAQTDGISPITTSKKLTDSGFQHPAGPLLISEEMERLVISSLIQSLQ
jgi:hypothetical protein